MMEFPGFKLTCLVSIIKRAMLTLFLTFLSSGCTREPALSVMKGAYWKHQAVEDILPFWTVHARDTVYGGFKTYLDGEWKPTQDSRKYPSMISRHIFGYAVAYLLTGENKYLDIARDAKGWLIDNCWDREFGGWFDELDEMGNPVLETKNMFVQVYAITGLAMYYFVTRDRHVLEYIDHSNQLLEARAWDKVYGGYYNVMSRNWTVADNRKTFAAQVAPVSGYLLFMYLATGDEQYIDQSGRIMDVVLDKMADPEQGWILENFDHAWNYLPGSPDEVNIGHNLEVAWMLMRLALLQDDPVRLNQATEIVTLLERWGYDGDTGFWYATLMKDDPENHADFTHWWIQAYGNMYSLYRYRTLDNESALTRFIEGAEAWENNFIDRESGGTWLSVHINGDIMNPAKANRFKSSYHSLEHCLLNFIYLHAWVELQPFELHFSIEAQSEPGILHPVPVEDPGIIVKQVKFNGEIREDAVRSGGDAVVLPAGESIRVSVSLQMTSF
jgi:cellobiose epimerase